MAFRFAAADTQAQGGAAGNSGFFAITRRNHRNFQASLVQAPSRKLLADFFEKGTEHGGCAASDDDDVGLQQIHDVAKPDGEDRKSTRLNSSHVSISYAVFCLKKKKKQNLKT